MIAQTACSRDEPVPKFGPASRILAAANRSSLRTKLRSSRQAAKRPLPKPVRSTLLSQEAGMIWSVSTSERSRGTARPVTTRTACIVVPSWDGRGWEVCGSEVLGAGEVTGHRRGGGHGRRHEVRAPARALAALEVAVGRGG